MKHPFHLKKIFHQRFGSQSRDELTLSKDSEEDDRSQPQAPYHAHLRDVVEISYLINNVLPAETLLQHAIESIQRQFDLYYVGIFILDEKNEYAILKAGSGLLDDQTIPEGFSIEVKGPSLISWSIVNRQPRAAGYKADGISDFVKPLFPQTRSEIALPLIAGGQLLGALTIQSSAQDAFTDNDLFLYQILADTLAMAIVKARLAVQVQENQAAIDTINQQYLVDAWKKVAGSMKQEMSSFAEEDDVPTDDLPTVRLPMKLRGQPIGVITLNLSSPELQPEDRAFVEQVTYQAALALENVRLLEETRRRAHHERLVSEIVAKVRSSTDVETILQTTLNELGRAMQAEEGMIGLDITPKTVISHTTGSE